VIDHSVQVDRWATREALEQNVAKEYERNTERYQLLRWAQGAFDKFRVVPPGAGIVHQVNLENLATVVRVEEVDGAPLAFPDSCVGTDSHTTMISGLGVLGFGVGGIEAEAVLLGEPLFSPIPTIVGLRLTGRLPAGTTATDLVLTVTAPRAWRGWCLCGGVRRRTRNDLPRRPRNDRQHVARVRRNDHPLPHR